MVQFEFHCIYSCMHTLFASLTGLPALDTGHKEALCPVSSQAAPPPTTAIFLRNVGRVGRELQDAVAKRQHQEVEAAAGRAPEDKFLSKGDVFFSSSIHVCFYQMVPMVPGFEPLAPAPQYEPAVHSSARGTADSLVL